MDEKSFDKFAEEYDEILAQSLHTNEAGTRYFAKHKVALMAKCLKGRTVVRVLDFGCGPGRSLPLLRRCFPGAEVCGFDPSEPCVVEARARCPEARVFGSLDDPGLMEGGGFDGILMSNVLHHIVPAARAETMRRCAAILAPGGSVFIVEHNPRNPVTRRVFERCPFDVGAVMLPRQELLGLGRAAGLKTAASGYTLFFPPSLGFLRGLEWMLTWLPLGAQQFARFER